MSDCRLTGKMTGAGLRSVPWASVITLDSTSVITLVCPNVIKGIRPYALYHLVSETKGDLGPKGHARSSSRRKGISQRRPPECALGWLGWAVLPPPSGYSANDCASGYSAIDCGAMVCFLNDIVSSMGSLHLNLGFEAIAVEAN